MTWKQNISTHVAYWCIYIYNHIHIVSWFLVTLVMSCGFLDTHVSCGACGGGHHCPSGDITVLRIQAEQEEAKTREDTKIKALEGELVWNLSIQPFFLGKVKIQDSSLRRWSISGISDWDPWIQLEFWFTTLWGRTTTLLPIHIFASTTKDRFMTQAWLDQRYFGRWCWLRCMKKPKWELPLKWQEENGSFGQGSCFKNFIGRILSTESFLLFWCQNSFMATQKKNKQTPKNETTSRNRQFLQLI